MKARTDCQQLGLFDDGPWVESMDKWLFDTLQAYDTVSPNDQFSAEAGNPNLTPTKDFGHSRDPKRASAIWARWVNLKFIVRDYTIPPLKPVNPDNNGRRVNVYRRGQNFASLIAAHRTQCPGCGSAERHAFTGTCLDGSPHAWHHTRRPA